MNIAERKIGADDDGIRLDRWFKRHLAHVPFGVLQKSTRKGLVRLEGKKADTSDRIAEGQALTFPEDWLKTDSFSPADKPKQVTRISKGKVADLERHILYEDKDILVLNKPAGLAAQGGTGQKESVDAILAERARAKGGERPRLVHRLDRDTSGVLVLGKSANAAAELAAAFAHKRTEKYYWALVVGIPSPEEGTIDLPLAKKQGGKDSRMEKMRGDEDGKKAITHFQTIDRAGNKLAWVELMPVTGRTHQLRVHMEAIGNPILGDGKYGGSGAFIEGEEVPKQLHLHARKLVIPFKGKLLEVEAPLLGAMKKSWKLFEFEEPKIAQHLRRGMQE